MKIKLICEDHEYPSMTKPCLVDCLKQRLASIESKEGKYDNRKYYNQAHNLIKIGAFKPVSIFHNISVRFKSRTDYRTLYSR